MKRQICSLTAGGKSFELQVLMRFLRALKSLFRDETNGIPAYAQQLNRQVPEIRVIDHSNLNFDVKFDEES